MKIVSLAFTFFSVLAISSCDKTSNCKSNGKDCACYSLYAPVCGCDNITYENDCRANCVDIEIVSQGKCPE